MLPENKRIHSKEDLNRFINIELQNYRVKKWELFIPLKEKCILGRHNYFLRKYEYHLNNKHRIRCFLFGILLTSLQNKYGMHISANCCDEGLKIMHLGNITMNGNSCVGKNCSFHVSTGLVAGGLTSDSPILGNGVVIGIGAIVLGGVKIADNVAIGANAVVNKDVLEENIAVAGIPARKISNNGRLNWNKDQSKKHSDVLTNIVEQE